MSKYVCKEDNRFITDDDGFVIVYTDLEDVPSGSQVTTIGQSLVKDQVIKQMLEDSLEHDFNCVPLDPCMINVKERIIKRYNEIKEML